MNTGLMSTKFFTDGINAVGPSPPKIPLPPFPSHLPLEKETLEEDGWCSPDLGSVFCLSPRQNKYILSPLALPPLSPF